MLTTNIKIQLLEIIEKIMHNIPRIGIGVVVIKDDHCVLLKRQGSHGHGEWSLPGGHLEFGESVEDCARREILEEFGVNLFNLEKLDFYTENFFPGKHYITLYLMGNTNDIPTIMEPEKASDIMLLRLGEPLPTPVFCGLDKVWSFIHY